MTLYFPGVSSEDFDFKANWLVKALDSETKQILFEGQDNNTGLEMTIDYKANPEIFNQFSLGELVQLPKELFVDAKEEPFQPISELF